MFNQRIRHPRSRRNRDSAEIPPTEPWQLAVDDEIPSTFSERAETEFSDPRFAPEFDQVVTDSSNVPPPPQREVNSPGSSFWPGLIVFTVLVASLLCGRLFQSAAAFATLVVLGIGGLFIVCFLMRSLWRLLKGTGRV